MISTAHLMEFLKKPEVLAALFEEEFLEAAEEGRYIRKRPYVRHKETNRSREHGFALNEMELLSDKEFTRMFRLNRSGFNHLLEKISPAISGKSLWNNHHHHQNEVPVKTKLAATLRWLAGGSYLDICFAFGISDSMFFKEDGVLWKTMRAINETLQIVFPINDETELDAISEGFSKFCYNRLKGCVMAMDGWVCKTRCPYQKGSSYLSKITS
jgi:hypothetical protein